MISPDGRYVAFKALSTHSPGVHVFWHDLDTSTTTMVATNSHPNTHPALSTDGRWLAFENNNAIYLHDTEHGTNLLVSVNAAATGPADGVSLRPVVTPGGQHVAFVSSATDLTPTPPASGTNASRVYLRDVIAGGTRLVSVNTNGEPSGSDMEHVLPAISADGRLVAFDTEAADLVSDDLNGASDVFLRGLMANTTELISRRLPDRPARTGMASAGISAWSISADGRRIAFTGYDDHVCLMTRTRCLTSLSTI